MVSSMNSELQSTLATMSKVQEERDTLSMRTQSLEANLQVRQGRGGGREESEGGQ